MLVYSDYTDSVLETDLSLNTFYIYAVSEFCMHRNALTTITPIAP